MNTITDARLALAAACRAAVPNIPVFQVPPTQIAAPCVVVALQECEQTGPGLWQQAFEVKVVGPSGDNDAAILGVEEMLLRLAPALSGEFSQPVSWERPRATISVGQIYMSTSFKIIIDVVPI